MTSNAELQAKPQETATAPAAEPKQPKTARKPAVRPQKRRVAPAKAKSGKKATPAKKAPKSAAIDCPRIPHPSRSRPHTNRRCDGIHTAVAVGWVVSNGDLQKKLKARRRSAERAFISLLRISLLNRSGLSRRHRVGTRAIIRA
jgi:hypothetical protein